MIDPELGAVMVYRRRSEHSDERYERVAELTLEAGDTLTTPLLPDLELPLAKIFAV